MSARLITALLACLVASCGDSSVSSTGKDSTDWPEIDARLEAAVTPAEPGGGCDTAEVCGIEFRFGDVPNRWYDRAFGDWERDQRVRIASAGKWLVAATLMTLVDDGVLALDEPIGTYWPGLDAAHAAITTRQILSHTSGIFHQYACTNDQVVHTLQQCAQEILLMPLVAEPGTLFMYGSSSFQVAGAIAERLAGQPWRELFQQRLGEPLGLTQTAFGSTQGTYDDTTQNPQLAGGGISTASEYDAFLEMMMQRGVYQGRRVLSEQAWEEMRRDSARGAYRFECPMAEEDCRAIGWGTVGFVLGSPSSKAIPYGLGNFLLRSDAQERGVLMTCPGAYGVRGWVDMERRYRALMFMDGESAASGAIFRDVLPMLEARIPAQP